MRTRDKAVGVVLCGLLVLAGVAAWAILFPHLYEAGPMTRAQALRHSPIDLPASAHDVYVADFHHAQQCVQYVRFKAPPADCLAHAKALLPGEIVKAFTAEDAAGMQAPFDPGVFRDLSPFDVRSVKHGHMLEGTTDGLRTTLWIDDDRGIFCFSRTD